MKLFIQYLSNPTVIAISQLVLILLLCWQFRLTLELGLTNPEGTATILEAIPINNSSK